MHKLCELYVDVDPPLLVEIGKVYNLGSTIHRKKIEDDNVRVVIEEVIDSNAQVLFLIDEVQIVGHALNHFIQWPKRLVRAITTKKDLLGVYLGTKMLNISIMQLWLLYIHDLCTNNDNIANIYGFMGLHPIQNVGNTADDQNNVVALYSLHNKRIDHEIKSKVESAMDEYHRMMGLGSTNRKKPIWIFPCQTQPRSYEYGYYVIEHILKIVTDNINTAWKHNFDNSGPMPDEDIASI
ncbi:hypothetical protein JHK82_012042 [Glycine max]|uniref:DUF8039 domain-containing protein n=2 Tax=Glycine subgen. Soja TaxID=1462606 RepID=A0A0R0JSB8_SOYBN|nr:hypothetical protein JHK85_012364 [Glycine max]KAG5057039.1 hypothetical protein JHK86_012035 [Glycine max]KAG5154073.1 hypothetical protein JHK82_012042 [Glycine max]KAH1133167.1 hypothetical protein GYH30_011836 [Glycine max]RZC11350.1 hypothetical protein D0Y65_011517 [Glycine soja]